MNNYPILLLLSLPWSGGKSEVERQKQSALQKLQHGSQLYEHNKVFQSNLSKSVIPILTSRRSVLAVHFRKTNCLSFFSLQRSPASQRLIVPSGLLSICLNGFC